MPILRPEELAQKYGIDTEPKKIVPSKPGAADVVSEAPTTVYPMSEREAESFSSRSIQVDPQDPYRAWDLRYQRQSIGDRFGNALARGLIGAVGVALEDASYMTLQPLGELTGALDEWEQNIIAEWGNKLKEEAHERFPNYKEHPNKLDWSPWAILGDLIENGLGFALPGVGAARTVASLSRAAKASKVGAWASYVKNGLGATGSLQKASNFILPGVISNYAEGTMMGFETYKTLIEEGYTDEEASAAADEVRRNNTALMISDMLQLHGIYKGTKALRNTMRNPSEWKENIKSALTSLNTNNPFFQGFVEGGEEIIQGIIQREAESRVTGEGRELDFQGRLANYLNEGELWYEGVLGFLSGGAQQSIMKGVSDYLDHRNYNKIQEKITATQAELQRTTDPQEKIILEKRIEDLKDEANRTTQKGMYEAQQELIKKNEELLANRYKDIIEADVLMRQALEANDDKSVEIIKSAEFAKTAYLNMARGTLDTLERQLEGMRDEILTDEEIQDKGFDKDYKKSIQRDIDFLKELESDYLKAQQYINPGQVYHANHLIRVQNQMLTAVNSAITDAIEGTFDSNKNPIIVGLKSIAESIAASNKASAFNFNKWMQGGLKLGDIEDESERNKLRKTLEQIEETSQYKKFSNLEKTRKTAIDEIGLKQKYYDKITSREYQEKLKERFREIEKKRKESRQAEVQKEKMSEERKKRTQKSEKKPPVQEVKEEVKKEEVKKEEVKDKIDFEIPPAERIPTPVEPAPKVEEETPVISGQEVESHEEETPSEVLDKVLDSVKSDFDQSLSDEDVNQIQRNESRDKALKETEIFQENAKETHKVTTKQRKTFFIKGSHQDADNDYIRDENGEVLEDIRAALSDTVKEGTEIYFDLDPYVRINQKGTYDEQFGNGEIISSIIPIRIFTKDGVFLGFVPSVKLGSSQSLVSLREEIVSNILDGVIPTGVITSKWNRRMFALAEGGVMNGQKAFPVYDDLAVIRKDGKVHFSGQRADIPEAFRAYPGYTLIITPDGNYVAGWPNKIDEGHANIIIDATEIYLRLNHKDNKGKKIEDILSPELLKSYEQLKAIKINPKSNKSLRTFISRYLFSINPDEQYDALFKNNPGKFSSPLAAYAYSHQNLSNTRTANKPMVSITGNGIAFLENAEILDNGRIGYSVSTNSPLEFLDQPLWRDALKRVITSSYRNTDIGHLNSTVTDISKDNDGNYTTKSILYNKLVKEGLSTRYKSTNIGTEENPQWVHTVNPIIHYSLNKQTVEKNPIDSVDEQPPVTDSSLDKKDDIEKPSESILDKVSSGEITVQKALSQLKKENKENTPEYQELKERYKKSKFGSSDDIIISNLPVGTKSNMIKVQQKLRGELLKKGYITSDNKVIDYPNFVALVNKHTNDLETEIRTVVYLPNSFRLARIARYDNLTGKFNWVYPALGFYDFAVNQGTFTQTNVNAMSHEFSKVLERYVNTGNIEEFVNLSKNHRINCK